MYHLSSVSYLPVNSDVVSVFLIGKVSQINWNFDRFTLPAKEKNKKLDRNRLTSISTEFSLMFIWLNLFTENRRRKEEEAAASNWIEHEILWYQEKFLYCKENNINEIRRKRENVIGYTQNNIQMEQGNLLDYLFYCIVIISVWIWYSQGFQG